VETARSGMRSGVMGVRMWGYRLLSQGRRSGWLWGMRGRCKERLEGGFGQERNWGEGGEGARVGHRMGYVDRNNCGG